MNGKITRQGFRYFLWCEGEIVPAEEAACVDDLLDAAQVMGLRSVDTSAVKDELLYTCPHCQRRYTWRKGTQVGEYCSSECADESTQADQ